MTRRGSTWLATIVAVMGSVSVDAKVTAPAGATVFRLDGAGVTYALGVDDKGYLQPLYWGPPLGTKDPLGTIDPARSGEPVLLKAPGELSGFDPAGSVTPQEYPGQGEGLVSEPGVKAVFADGNRDLVLKYRSHRV